MRDLGIVDEKVIEGYLLSQSSFGLFIGLQLSRTDPYWQIQQ